MNIREVTAASAGDKYLLPDTIGPFKNGDPAAAIACLSGTK